MEHTMSWWDIVKNIDEKTPYVVIRDLCILSEVGIIDLAERARNERKDFYDMVNEILSGISLTFSIPLEDADVPRCIRFINPATNLAWTRETVEHAITWTQAFIERPRLPHGYFYHGYQGPGSPKSYNAIMLYVLLRNEGVTELAYDATTEMMANLVMVLILSKERGRDILYNTVITKLNSEQLAGMYQYGVSLLGLANNSAPYLVDFFESDEIKAIVEEKYKIPEPKETDEHRYSNMERASNYLRDRDYLCERVNPISNSEAIVLAARLYDRDISRATDPIDEYLHLRSRREYIPKDESIRRIYAINQTLCDLKITFNPLLPEGLYKPSNLMNMALGEGYTQAEIDDDNPYSLLQVAYYSDTFHHGKQPGMINTTTLADDDIISELHTNIIVCFGIPLGAEGRRDKSMYAYRYRDLSTYFKREQYFRNPIIYPIGGITYFHDTIFSDTSIQKLKLLCEAVYVDDTQAYIAERKELLITLIDVEIINDENLQKVLTLKKIYDTGDEGIKVPIRVTISKLFRLAMIMRGWTEGLDYPLSTSFREDDNILAIRVTDSIIDFTNSCTELATLEINFMDLPLYLYDNNQFIPSSDQKEGRTIGERLVIVKNGENHQDTNSCIKLSSGWFACTAQYLAINLDLEPLFDLEYFETIS